MEGLIPSCRSSAEEITRTREGQIFSAGFFLFGFAFVLDGVSDLLTYLPSFASNAKFNVVNWSLFLAFGILSVAGLMIMTIADLDINEYLSRNQIRMNAFVLLCAAANMMRSQPLPAKGMNTLPIVPFLVLLCRYEQVVGMRKGYPLFTQLLLASLWLHALGDAIGYLVTNEYRVFSCYMLAALLMFGAQYWHMPGNSIDQGSATHHTATYQFKVTSYAFLFGYGFATGCSAVIKPASPVTLLSLQWAFVVIHMLPPLLALINQQAIKRTLGLRWLSRRREARESMIELACTERAESRGNLIEIEEAIIDSKVGLNAFVLTNSGCCHSHHEDGAGGDDVTLLHLAVLNDHLDALQRLLNTGLVEINKPTGRRGKSALFLAAEEGRLHAATMLLEHNADVNALTDEGQSPLIVAASHGHKKLAALLRQHGAATDYKWMGLAAADVMRKQGSSSSSSTVRSSEGVERKRTERPVLEGGPGWLDETGRTDSSSSGSSLYR
eukprot:g1392.t1